LSRVLASLRRETADGLISVGSSDGTMGIIVALVARSARCAAFPKRMTMNRLAAIATFVCCRRDRLVLCRRPSTGHRATGCFRDDRELEAALCKTARTILPSSTRRRLHPACLSASVDTTVRPDRPRVGEGDWPQPRVWNPYTTTYQSLVDVSPHEESACRTAAPRPFEARERRSRYLGIEVDDALQPVHGR
jgi:hypothetical protein